MPPILQFALCCLVLTASVFDWRFRRIPNWVCLSGLILGLGLNTAFFSWTGCGSALLGMALALIIYIPLYCLRGMGAGDVKLMAAVGAMAGPGDWLEIFVVTALAGGLVSLAVILYKRRLGHTILNLSVLTGELLHLRRPAQADPELDVKNSAALRMPHAVPIALGCLIFLAFASN